MHDLKRLLKFLTIAQITHTVQYDEDSRHATVIFTDKLEPEVNVIFDFDQCGVFNYLETSSSGGTDLRIHDDEE